MEDDIFDLYESLDLSGNAEGALATPMNGVHIHETFGRLTPLARIEKFVDKISSSTDLAFDVRVNWHSKSVFITKRLGHYYRDVQRAIEEYLECYAYSVKVDEFYEACRSLNLLAGYFSFEKPFAIEPVSGRFYADIFNELVKVIRMRCGSSKFRARLKRQHRNGRRRAVRGLMWEREMFDWRSRHLFIMLCLGYQPDVRQSIEPEEVQRHLHRLLNNRRSNSLLDGIDGYVWKIEEGRKSGLHVHILIAYSTGSKGDILIAKKIGNYWREVVTGGKGACWNSNVDKFAHQRRGHGMGTGQINHFDEEARRALRANILYLTKSDQYLTRKGGTKFRTFGMSQPPQKSALGRPRLRGACLLRDSIYSDQGLLIDSASRGTGGPDHQVTLAAHDTTEIANDPAPRDPECRARKNLRAR